MMFDMGLNKIFIFSLFWVSEGLITDRAYVDGRVTRRAMEFRLQDPLFS